MSHKRPSGTESLHVRVAPALFKAAKKWADAEMRTVNNFVEVAIKEAVERREIQKPKA